MLLVKTTVAPSSIHGLGLFATESITKGQRIWEFTRGFDLHFKASEVMALPDIAKSQILHYSYVHSSIGTYVLCADDARFFNHSDTPNCDDFLFDSESSAYTLAMRDIAVGEELTVDYGEFDARYSQPNADFKVHD